MKTMKLSDVPSLTDLEKSVLKDMFGGEIIPVKNARNAEALAKAILADINSQEVEVE